MPTITLARTSGFCMGVKRAMQIALQTAAKAPGRVFTSGPLIHNPQAVEYLRENGVGTVKDWHTVQDGTIIIRAHGMPSDQIREIAERGLEIVDATCPHVVTSQRQIKKYNEKGYYIYIIGDPDHPEILSLQSFAAEQEVIDSEEQAKKVLRRNKVMIIGQTTFNEDEFNRIAAILEASADEAIICDSICQATSDRQHEIRKLAADADAVVIVGGKSSANTRRLAEIAAELCPRTFHVETEAELCLADFADCQHIVVSAGASTPDFITQKVIEFLAGIEKMASK